MQAAIVVIVFGAVCALVGFFMGEHTGYQEGWEAAGKAFDDLICEHPQPPNMDGYYQLLRDIAEIPEVKIPPEWE